MSTSRRPLLTYPVVSQSALESHLGAVTKAIKAGDDLSNHILLRSPDFTFPPIDGHRVSSKELAFMREALSTIMNQVGSSNIDALDSAMSSTLYRSMNLLPSQAGNDQMWATLATFVLPDVVAHRFASDSVLSEARLRGGRRNAIRRLWFRRHCIDEETERQFEELLDQDLIQQIVERPSLASDRRTVLVMLHALDRYRDDAPTMRAFAREVLKEVTLFSAICVPQLLTEEELERELLKRARRVLRKQSKTTPRT